MKKIYKFLGKWHNLITLLIFPINFPLGFVLGRCIVNQSWIWFGIILFGLLLWLIVIGVSAHSYEHLYKR